MLKNAEARADFPCGAMPNAGLDDRRQFPQQHRLHARRVDRLHRICEAGVGDQFRIHYDPSHAILMGQDTRSIFQCLNDAGYGFLIGGFHVKGQVIDSKGVATWGYGGQTLGAATGSAADLRTIPRINSMRGRNRSVRSTNCRARRGMISLTCESHGRWLDHQLAARLLPLDAANTHLVVEHEYPRARIQDRERS